MRCLQSQHESAKKHKKKKKQPAMTFYRHAQFPVEIEPRKAEEDWYATQRCPTIVHQFCVLTSVVWLFLSELPIIMPANIYWGWGSIPSNLAHVNAHRSNFLFIAVTSMGKSSIGIASGSFLSFEANHPLDLVVLHAVDMVDKFKVSGLLNLS